MKGTRVQASEAVNTNPPAEASRGTKALTDKDESGGSE